MKPIKKEYKQLRKMSQIFVIIMIVCTMLVCFCAIASKSIALFIASFFCCALTGYVVGCQSIINIYDSWLDVKLEKEKTLKE